MATVNLTDFDPNVDTFWLACMSGRWKASLERKGALVVFRNWDTGKLYKVEAGQFILIADKDPHKHDGLCEQCGQSIHSARVRNQMRHYGGDNGYDWVRDGGYKIAEPLQLIRRCVDCIYGS
jgi:hypothetical protein